MDSTIGVTLEHVKFLARHLEKTNLRGAVIVFLMELRAPTKIVGFELIVQAILLQHKDPTRALANDIYLEVMVRNNQSSEEQVQQAIRETIKAAWEKGSHAAWDWYFSYDDEPVATRPCNSDFISRLAYILDLWEAHCGEAHYEDR
jgi:hypothetical protein